MLLELLTARKCTHLASEMKLFAHSALSVTVEMPSLIHPTQQGYHITMTKEDLEQLLNKIKEREIEIIKELLK